MASSTQNENDSITGMSETRISIVKLALGRDMNEDLHQILRNTPPAATVQHIQASMVGAGLSGDTARVGLALTVADVVDDNVGLAEKMLQDPKITSTRDIATNYGFSRAMSLTADGNAPIAHAVAAPAPEAAPPPHPGPDARARAVALGFQRRMFAIEPTAVLQQMIASEDEGRNPSENLPIHSSAAVRTEAAKFLARQPRFNIRTTPVIAALRRDEADMKHIDPQIRADVTESLKLLQTVQALAPTPEAIRPLLDAGWTDAMRLSSVPQKRFVAKIAPELAESGASPAEAEMLARNIHDHAMRSRLRADHALVQIHQAVRGTGLKAVDGESSLSERKLTFNRLASAATGEPVPIDLDTLFGDMDMCECEACLDVTSPTAYYVDLLQYLRNNDLDTGSSWSNTGQEGIVGTALEKLFLRRPDLQHLQLTCANANTALPMVDLANEVMEAFVIHASDFENSSKVVIETWNIGRETTDELLASPSHTRKKAYCILKEVVYPLASLPYFQPLDASRLYLNYLGTSRFELIDVFRLAQRQWPVRAALVTTPDKTAHYAQLRDQLQDRAAAAEFLGLSPDEYVIITRVSLWPIGCSEFADDGTIIDVDTYRKDIGVQDPFKYWGYSTDSELLSMDGTQKIGLSFVKAQFLVRSGLSFADTADLLRTKFVNPMMPTGKDKVLMDSIRFSYRLLQHLTIGITNISQRHKALAQFLFGTQAWVQSILMLQIPPTGNPLVKPEVNTPTFTKSEINSWVSKWFDCVGKLAVLEAGECETIRPNGTPDCPQLPVEGYLLWTPLSKAASLTMKRITSAEADGSSPPAADSQPKVLGYLDKKGELRDDKNDLVGFVWMDNRVYYGGLHLIRDTYPTGTIRLVQIPKQDVTPNLDELEKKSANKLFVQVNAESYLFKGKPVTVVKWEIPPDTCSIENTEIIHLNGTPLELWEWDRINRFIRLYEKLQPSGWTIPEVDAALTGLWKVPEIPPSTPSDPQNPQASLPGVDDKGFSFSGFKDPGCGGDDDDDDTNGDKFTSPCDPSNYMDITSGFLKELMSAQKLAQVTGLEFEKLLCLWSVIGTFGDQSLYTRLFLTHDLEAMDTVFLPDDNGNYLSAEPKIGDHVPVIVAALHLKASIFDLVLQRVGLTRDSIITITNLSKLYRHVLLSRILGIKPDALLDALDLFPKPYDSASATLDLYKLWLRMSDASFTVKQLRYIVLGADDPLRPIGPDKVKVLRTVKAIMDGLAAIDADQPDLTAQEEAVLTVAQVKAKATLIFAPPVVDDITGLIEGTKLFTTNVPVGLIIGSGKISAKLIYKDPLVPPNRRATLSVTGCLTDTEMTTALAAFPGNDGWSLALQRLKKQAENLVKNTLGIVFADDISNAIQVLTQGDVSPTQDPSGNQGDPGTAIVKRVYFTEKFMTFLRLYLYSKFIVTTMSGVASVSPDICAWLLTDVIKVGPVGSQKSAMQVLVDLKNQAASDPLKPWTGYLLPLSSDTYVFYGYGDSQPPPLIIGGASVTFATQNEDPSNLWWTAPVPLVGGKMTSLQVQGQKVPGDLQWKTARSGVVAIPPSALVPDALVTDATGIFAPLSKASMAIQGFSLDLIELQYLQSHKANFSGLDFNAIILDAWKRLLKYYELRKSLPSRETQLIDLFKWADIRDNATADEISSKISAVTVWDVDSIKVLLDKRNLDLGDVKLFRDEIAMSKLDAIFAFIEKVGITDVNLLLSWTDLKLDFNPTWKLAKSIRQAIRGKYTASDYEQAIKPSHDQLRRNQRDALIAYLLVQPAIQKWGVTDADGLFEFFLLDVQMGSCMQTSRTKQAISSVQLFVQRCMLGLEAKYQIGSGDLDSERWQWMSKQTVWTANRKVFLYPENWLIPSLRDDKTPIYTDMESELLQHEVNPSNALESFKGYVTRLAEISHLRAVGVYVEQVDAGKFVFHCLAMTITSPYLFFYRKCDLFAREWTPWIRISVDIPTYTIEIDISPPPPGIMLATPSNLVDVGDLGDPDDAGGIQPVDSFTGCYVVPVAWKSRTLLFIGEITKKAAPNTTALTTNFGDLTKPSSTTTADSASPKEIWEIKLSWTEYRSGKWTQKQIASSAFQTGSTSPAKTPPIDSFQFMPQIATTADQDEYVSIEIWRSVGTSARFLGNYVFNGTILQKGGMSSQDQPTNWMNTIFQLVGSYSSFNASSLQKSADGKTMQYINAVPFVTYAAENPNGIVKYMDNTTDIFYHPFSSLLVSAAGVTTENSNIGPIEGVYQSLPSKLSKFIDPAFGTGPSTPGTDGKQYPTYAELSKPYTNYNWELGFHGPMQVADALLSSQQFDQALAMIHHIFNPYADGSDVSRVWKWYPFQQAASQRVLETVLDQLKPHQFDLNVTKWRDHPFQPFVVARGRTVAYMKWTVMLYIKALIAYGDMYFRRRTLEDIPLAIQLYVLANHLYGSKGETIPKRGKKIPQTYYSLMDKWDAFSNAVVQLELAFPFSNQTPFPWGVIDDSDPGSKQNTQQIALANLFGFATSSYFCLPSNPDLRALRTTIDQRLYNIRHCLDIDGRPLPLVLWDPPLDPGELVAAIASGLSLSSALNNLNTSLPNYRFTWLLARALEITAELKTLEATFLSIKEKRDSEALQLLRSGHEITMHNMVMAMKKVQLEEANKTLIALRTSQESSKLRFGFYSTLAGVDIQPLGSTDQPFTAMNVDIDAPGAGELHLNKTETQEEGQAVLAQFWNNEAANLEVMAGILHALPSFNIHTTPMGCGIEVAWGMPNIAAAFQAQARQNQVYASNSNFSSSQAGRKATYIKQYQDRVHQMNLAGLEFNHITTQIDAQETRIQITNLDIANQQKLIDNATEVNQFLRNKYTNDDLYNYLESTMRTYIYQTYLLAYDLAKKAELAFRFERRPTNVQNGVDFVSFGYFNSARDGLQASHQLYLALKNMDAAYQDSRGHDYEVTKSISLRQLNPYALLTLRETGSCTFDVPEVLFDMDFPGHFFRRIKTVSLTMPCVVGPHVSVNATLRLLKHRYRADPLATSSQDYVEDMSGGGLDKRFRTAIIPIDAVAASSAQNDSGAFELSLKDERYVPFEGAGAVATWQLALPPKDFRPFDYASIADVVLSLRYTSCEGGEALRKVAGDSVIEWIANVESQSKEVGLLALWDVRAEFAGEWTKLFGPGPAGGGDDIRTLVLRGLNGRLPSFVAGRDPTKVLARDVSLVTNLSLSQAADIAIDFKYTPTGSEGSEIAFDSGPTKIGSSLSMFRISEAGYAIGDWALKIKLGPAVQVNSDSRLWLITRYRLLKNN